MNADKEMRLKPSSHCSRGLGKEEEVLGAEAVCMTVCLTVWLKSGPVRVLCVCWLGAGLRNLRRVGLLQGPGLREGLG